MAATAVLHIKERVIRMDEFEKDVVSFDNFGDEPETGKTVEIETPKPVESAPEVSTVIEPDTTYREPAHAVPPKALSLPA